jgi:hypothetical protein
MTRHAHLARAALAPLLLTAALAPGACTSAASSTGIIVEVTSDLAVPSALDEVRMTATSASGAPLYDRAFSIAGGASLPLRVGFTPEGGTGAAFRVEATGLRSGSRVVARSATVSFVSGRIVHVELPLLAVCAGMTCAAAGTTCIAGSCQPDGPGGDGGVMMDAATEAGTPPADAAPDAPPADAPPADAPPADAPPADAPPADALPDTRADAPQDAPVTDGGPTDAPPTVTTLNEGLVAYWSFDQMATSYPDHSGNANTATTTPNAAIVPGPYGGALDLTAPESSAGAPGSRSVNSITTAVSIAAWVLAPAAGQVHTLISRYLGVEYWKLGFSDNGALRFTANTRTIQTGGAVDSTRWVHVAATYDGATARLYINGSLATMGTFGAVSLVGGPAGQAGGYGPLIGATFMDVTAIVIEYYGGLVDELTLHNRALTPEEVAAMARGVFPMRR